MKTEAEKYIIKHILLDECFHMGHELNISTDNFQIQEVGIFLFGYDGITKMLTP